MHGLFELIALTDFSIGARRFQRGETLSLSARQAAALIADRRATLASHTDADRLAAAVRADAIEVDRPHSRRARTLGDHFLPFC